MRKLKQTAFEICLCNNGKVGGLSLTSSYSYSSRNVSLILLHRASIMRRVLTIDCKKIWTIVSMTSPIGFWRAFLKPKVEAKAGLAVAILAPCHHSSLPDKLKWAKRRVLGGAEVLMHYATGLALKWQLIEVKPIKFMFLQFEIL